MKTQSSIQQPLKEKLMSYRNLYAIKETTTNKSQFEKNNRAEYVINFIESICETMDEQYSLIGKQVVKFEKHTKYTTVEMYNNDKDVNKIWKYQVNEENYKGSLIEFTEACKNNKIDLYEVFENYSQGKENTFITVNYPSLKIKDVVIFIEI